ncbi:hypothetical protein [Pontibacter sp. BAB1700]|uniref:hypothetical protein n=1 Tax=Pontibacter sp. BAB1700 TaxID=1144253 RepID=UPI0003099C99|nr:hypothetical protein [Pontibacter sp. BAB1700]
MAEKGTPEIQRPAFAFQQQQVEEINLKAILYKYVRYWYLFALSIAMALTLAFLYLRYTTPEYTIKSKVLIRMIRKGLIYWAGPCSETWMRFNQAKL